MIRRTVVRQKSKMLTIAFTIALGVSLSTAMMNVMLGIGDKVNRELKVYGANITVRHWPLRSLPTTTCALAGG